MRVRIIYFSGTGNTKFISEKLANVFQKYGVYDISVLSIEEAADAHIEDLESPDTILGIGYPVYDLMPPETIMNFVDRLSMIETQNKAFIFSTYTTNPMDSNDYLIAKLCKKGFIVTTQENFKAPGASAYLYSNPKAPFVRGKSVFGPKIGQEIEEFVKNILVADCKESISAKYNPLHGINVTLSKLIFGNMFYRKLKVNENCIACGKCVRVCPISNLLIEDGELIIRDPNGCMHCLRCIMTCNKKAIDFTSSKRCGDYSRDIIERQYLERNASQDD